MKFRPLQWILVLVPIVALVFLIGWRISLKKAEAAEGAKSTAARKNAAALVDTAPVTRRTITRTFEAVGSIEAPATVQIAPKVTGRLMTLTVREGDRVRVGQVIATVDPQSTLADVRQKEAALAEARSRLAEAKVTQSSQRVGVVTDIQKQQAALATSQAQNRQAKADFAASVATAEAAVMAAQERVTAANASIRSAEAAIGSAQANVDNARVQLQRQNALFAKGIVAQQVADNAATTLAVQEAALKAAQEERSNAIATRDAAVATQRSAERQVTIAQNKANADVAVANAALAQATAGLKASQANTAQTEAYQENLAALAASVASAQADLEASRVLLADTALRSSLDGLVTARLLEPGAVVTTTTPIVAVQSIRRVWATVSVPETNARRLTTGQTAQVTLDALPGQTFTGKIQQILPAADPQSRQFTVRVVLDNPDYRLRPGTFSRVTFIMERANDVLTVPQEAIKADAENPDAKSVMIVGADETAQRKSVKTGLSDDKGIAVSGEVAEGDKVIILSQREVKEGQKVRTGGDRASGDTNASGGHQAQGSNRSGVKGEAK